MDLNSVPMVVIGLNSISTLLDFNSISTDLRWNFDGFKFDLHLTSSNFNRIFIGFHLMLDGISVRFQLF